MILETTYTDKEVTKAINESVGNSFSFWERIKLGGIGSHRLVIEDVSDGLKKYINPGESTNYTNIELRPKGIIVHLKWRTQTYGWIIPFKDLTFANDLSDISDNDHQIHLKDPLSSDQSFVTKLKAQIGMTNK